MCVSEIKKEEDSKALTMKIYGKENHTDLQAV